MTYTREQLIRADDEDTCFVECFLCGGYGPIESDIHHCTCPFVDPEVDRVWVIGKKRMADNLICGRCDVDTQSCPAAAAYGIGWACTTHEQALKICERYRNKFEK